MNAVTPKRASEKLDRSEAGARDLDAFLVRNALILAWICIKQPGLALMLWRARHNIPELRKMRRALDMVDRR